MTRASPLSAGPMGASDHGDRVQPGARAHGGPLHGTYEFRPVDGDDSLAGVACLACLACLVIDAHAQPHPSYIHAEDVLVGHRHAVGGARQVVQHHLGPGQRRLGVDHPVVAVERFEPDASRRWRVAGITRQFTAVVRRAQRLDELAPEHLGQRVNGEQEGRAAFPV